MNNFSLNAIEGCAAVSESSGNLLFYTNGMHIADRNHAIMTNGTNLGGWISSTQSATIVKNPNTDQYYVFTIGDGLSYSEVDITLNFENVNFQRKTPTAFKLSISIVPELA